MMPDAGNLMPDGKARTGIWDPATSRMSSSFFSFSKHKPDGGFIQPQCFSKLVDHISFIRKMDPLWIINKADKCRWPATHLCGIVDLDAPSAVSGGLVFGNNGLK
jgi:hypothetical protein